MKKIRVIIIFALVVAGILIAGCTSTQAPPPATTLATTQTTVTPSSTGTTAPPFALKDYYLQGKYSFQSESEVRTEHIRVPNGQPWGIEFQVKTLNDDAQYCWFEMKVTNVDTGITDVYGYGRTNGYTNDQYIPRYNGGQYTIEMQGNLVMVNMNIGNRIP